jgi:hypothetical protein
VCETVDLIHLVQNTCQCQTLVSVGTNLRVQQITGDYFTRPIGFTMTWLHGVARPRGEQIPSGRWHGQVNFV